MIDPGAESPWTGFEQSRYITDANQLFDLALSAMGKLRRVPLLPWWQVPRAAEAAGATPSGPVMFECVGVPGIIDQIVTNAPLASRVVVVGVCMEPDTIRPAMAINKEIDLKFVFAYQPHEFRETLHLSRRARSTRRRSSPERSGSTGSRVPSTRSQTRSGTRRS